MKIFVIMPFDSPFDDVYDCIKLAIDNAIPGEKLKWCRLDDLKYAGKITEDLVKEIDTSVLCIADITANNPNVMWEVGYAQALNKPILFISQAISNLPFDLKDMRVIQYDRQNLSSTLRSKLSEAIKETFGRYEVRRESRRIKTPKPTPFTISVTGSRKADLSKCLRRVEVLLRPYLNKQTTWYCGPEGCVDETVVRFLAEQKQRVIVVGTHAFHISNNMLSLLEEYDIPFLDAQKEQLPEGLIAPCERDLFFATKSDLIILIWNQKSHGTEIMIKWYKEQGKDHIIGFI